MDKKITEERILIAGSGGQGVLLIGKMLASSIIDSVEHVTFFPSYGAEVRGGVSSCQLVLSSREIASPVSESFDTMILMNQSSFDRYIKRAADGCLIITNSSLCKAGPSLNVKEIPASDISNKMGATRAANFVLLGAYIARKRKNIVSIVENRINEMFRHKDKAHGEINVQAFRTGLTL